MSEFTQRSIDRDSPASAGQPLDRRQLLGTVSLATACGLGGWLRQRSEEQLTSRAEQQARPESPAAALQRLMDGNQRFASGQSAEEHRDLQRVRAVAREQKPFAAFLGCADSRVPIEVVFDQGFGDLFVTRIAGNIASSENIGSLEFGTQILGAQVLFVLGHTECGAVTAAIKGNDVPGQISGLFQHIRPAVKASQGDLNTAIEENVRNQATLLADASPVIRRLIQQGELIIAGGIYDLRTGVVSRVELGSN